MEARIRRKKINRVQILRAKHQDKRQETETDQQLDQLLTSRKKVDLTSLIQTNQGSLKWVEGKTNRFL